MNTLKNDNEWMIKILEIKNQSATSNDLPRSILLFVKRLMNVITMWVSDKNLLYEHKWVSDCIECLHRQLQKLENYGVIKCTIQLNQ